MDKSSYIFSNEISKKTIKQALNQKKKLIKKYGDDSNNKYYLSPENNPVLSEYFNTDNLVLSDNQANIFDDKSIIIGNIRMGFGHYRISMAMASAANALGYKPYWFDLNSFTNTTCGKVIKHQNDLYSLGSRLSQKSVLFNKYWENLNSEGFRKISYNAKDQKNAELMSPLCRALPKEIPFVATHVWPAQAAIHAGLTNVVNAIPDNWPMALHLAEGAIHATQTPSSALGYKALRGMSKHPLKPMPDDVVYCTGHYIDHELVVNIENDCEERIKRIKTNKTKRYLMTVGGAGAGTDLFIGMINHLMPEIKSGKATLFINFGDHDEVYKKICETVKDFNSISKQHFNDFNECKDFVNTVYNNDINGIHCFYNKDIYAAVYLTNLLMRCTDIMITKPSELAFYPVPKLMIKRVGGHEAFGAIRTAEIGDGTYECDTLEEINTMIDLLQNDNEVIENMCKNIISAKNNGIYDGAYNVIKLALNNKNK